MQQTLLTMGVALRLMIAAAVVGVAFLLFLWAVQ